MEDERAVPIDQVAGTLAALYAARTRPTFESVGWTKSAWESLWQELCGAVVDGYNAIVSRGGNLELLQTHLQALMRDGLVASADLEVLSRYNSDLAGELRSRLAQLLVLESLADDIVAYEHVLWKDKNQQMMAGKIDIVTSDAYRAIVPGRIRDKILIRLEQLIDFAQRDRKNAVVYYNAQKDDSRALRPLHRRADYYGIKFEAIPIPWN